MLALDRDRAGSTPQRVDRKRPPAETPGPLRQALRSPGRLLLFLVSAAVYAAICGRHVWGHDEAHSLLLIRACHSLPELIQAIRYEGSPGLYHFLIWCVGHLVPLTVPVLSAIHGVILTLLIGVVCFRLPMPTLAAYLLLVQPFFIWHAYNVRQYALGTLLVFLWVSQFRPTAPRLTLRATLPLALAAQCSAHLALCAAFLHLIGWACTGLRFRREDWVCHGLMAAAGLLAAAQLIPPADLMPGLRTWESQTAYFHLLVAAVVRTAILDDYLVSTLLLGAVCAGIAQIWRRSRESGLVILLSVLLMFWICIVVAHFKYATPYHHAIITVFLISVALSLCRGQPIPPGLARFGTPVWIAAILITLVPSLEPLQTHLLGQRSYTREVASYLTTHFPDRPLLAHKEFFSAPVRVYLPGIPRVFSLGRMQWIEATRWNHAAVDWREVPFNDDVLLQDILLRMRAVPADLLAQRPVLLAAGYNVEFDEREVQPGEGYEVGPFRMIRRASFTKGDWEKYHVFEIVPAPPGSVAPQRNPPGTEREP